MTGSCLCGEIEFEVDEIPGMVFNYEKDDGPYLSVAIACLGESYRGKPVAHAFVGSKALGRYVDELYARRRFRNGLSILSQAFDVEFNRFLNELDDGFTAFGGGHAAGQVRHIGAEPGVAFLDHHCVTHDFPHHLSPACLSIALSVPGGTSAPGLPATVMVPVLRDA